MGTTVYAQCACSEQGTSVMLGSSRREYGQVFYQPQACNACRSVVSVNLLAVSCLCPNCGSSDLERYGESVTAAPYGRWHRFVGWVTGRSKRDQAAINALRAKSVATGYCSALRTTYGVPSQLEKCPKCQQRTLKFSFENLYS